MKKRRIIQLALLTGLLYACSTPEKIEERNVKLSTHNVRVHKAKLSGQNEELSLTGKVEYNADKVVHYKPLVNGLVVQSYFGLGDKVKRGQDLLEIRSSDLSELQSSYSTLKNDIVIAERELQTAQAMYDDNMLSEKDLLEAKAKLHQSKTAQGKVQDDMSVYGKNKGKGVFAVQSQMDGYIVTKNVSTGSTVSGDSDALFTVADLSTVWITVNVYANNLQFVKEGMPVTISFFSYPNELFYGKIDRLSQVFDPEEKVLKARIEMPNPELKFKPEMSAIIRLTDESRVQSLSVPTDALIFDLDKYYLVVKDASDTFKIQEVKLQGHHNGVSYISAGIVEGAEVVVKNQLLIYTELKES